MTATSRMRELKMREDEALSEVPVSREKFTNKRNCSYWELVIAQGTAKLHTGPPSILAISCQSVSFHSRRRIGKDLRGNMWHRELKTSVPRAAQSNRTNQSMTVPNTRRRGNKGSSFLSWKHCTEPNEAFCMQAKNNWCFSGRIDRRRRWQQSKD